MFILDLKNSHKSVGHFSVDSPPYDLQHGRGVKVLPYQSGQHQREQHLCKFFNGKLRCEGVSPDFGIIPQHRAQGIQNVLPGPMHLLLSIGGVLLDKAQRMMGEKSRIPLAAVLQLLVHPPDTGQGVLKDSLILRMMEDIAPDAFHRGAQ